MRSTRSADPLTGDAVFLADGFKCTTLPARNEAKTIRQDAASTIGETREEFFRYVFRGK